MHRFATWLLITGFVLLVCVMFRLVPAMGQNPTKSENGGSKPATQPQPGDSLARAQLSPKADEAGTKVSVETEKIETIPLWAEAEERVGENPREALQWLAQLPDKQYQAVMMDEKFRSSFSHMAEALAGRATLAGKNGNAELQNYISLWAGVDGEAASSWVMQQTSGDSRDELVGRVAAAYSEAEPQDAAHLAIAGIPPGRIQEEAIMTVLHEWGLQDMEGASAWVRRFPLGPLRDRATCELQALAQSAAAK